MKHLIDKSALVAEIEKQLKFQQTCIKTGYRLTGKAEGKSLIAYPQKIQWVGNQWDGVPSDVNSKSRDAYKQGYHQAEKDLELGWEDIQKIDVLIYAVLDEEKYKRYYTQDRDGDFYEEVLKRFKATKEHGTK